MKNMKIHNILKYIDSLPRILPLCVVATLCMSACDPKIDKTGYVFSEDVLGEITPGQSDKEAVLSTLGSPSSRSSFGPESWYYINNTKESYAFLKYEITEQDVVRINFDELGLVDDIKHFNMDDSKDIDIVQRQTPSEGHSMGFFEQILGNIGRFNAPGSSNQQSNNRRAPPGR